MRGRRPCPPDPDLAQHISLVLSSRALTITALAEKIGLPASTLTRNRDCSFSQSVRAKVLSGLGLMGMAFYPIPPTPPLLKYAHENIRRVLHELHNLDILLHQMGGTDTHAPVGGTTDGDHKANTGDDR